MSVNPSLALQKAIIETLRADASLTAMLGGPRVYDRPPRRMNAPCVNIGAAEIHHWNTFTARGHEHRLTLHVWTRHGGRKSAYEIIARLDELLDDADLALQDHHLVNLRAIFWTAMRADDGLFQGIMRLRATTHPLN